LSSRWTAPGALHDRDPEAKTPCFPDNSKKHPVEIYRYRFLGLVGLVGLELFASCKRLWLATESTGPVWRPGRLLVVSYRAIVAGS